MSNIDDVAAKGALQTAAKARPTAAQRARPALQAEGLLSIRGLIMRGPVDFNHAFSATFRYG